MYKLHKLVQSGEEACGKWPSEIEADKKNKKDVSLSNAVLDSAGLVKSAKHRDSNLGEIEELTFQSKNAKGRLLCWVLLVRWFTYVRIDIILP